MNERRNEAINHLLTRLHGLRKGLLMGTQGCNFMCRSVAYGALTLEMNSESLLSPTLAAPFLGLSYKSLVHKVVSFQSPRWYDGPGNSYRHVCALSRFESLVGPLNRIEGLQITY